MSSLHSLSTTRRSTASRRGRTGLATAAVLLTVAPLAAACGAGFNAASTQVKLDSGSGSTGALKVNNVWVVVDPASGNAEVVGSVANNGDSDVNWPDVQVNGTAARIVPGGIAGAPTTGASPAAAEAGGSAANIPAGQSVNFGQAGQPGIELPSGGLTLGSLTNVTFSFGAAGTATVTAQVEPNTGLFAQYNPNPPSASPSPSASASASASSSALAGAGSSPSPGASSSVLPGTSPSATAK